MTRRFKIYLAKGGTCHSLLKVELRTDEVDLYFERKKHLGGDANFCRLKKIFLGVFS